METNILIVGVGGQGTLLASRVLGAIAVNSELDCKLSEVHGMSQRGGSVVTHIRIGASIYSPMIDEGAADYIICFESLEALRWNHFLKKGGKMLINNQEIMPMPVITGASDYPQDIYGKLKELGKDILVIDGLKLATLAGNSKAVNVVMIGALAKLMDIDYEVAQLAVKNSVPAKLLGINLTALELGYNL